MLPCGIVLVLSRFQVMTESNPGVMRGLHMVARFVVLGGLAMMFGSFHSAALLLRDAREFCTLSFRPPGHVLAARRATVADINDSFAIGPAICDADNIGVGCTDSLNMRAQDKIGS